MNKKSTKLFTLALLFLSGTVFAQPSNDNCAGAITLTQSATCQTVSGDVTGGTESMPSCSPGGDANNDVWYKFTSTSPDFFIEVTGSSSFDVVVEAFSGTCGNLTSEICMDNFSNGTENIDATQNPLATYYLRVYEYNPGTPATTTFDICVFGTSTAGIEDNEKTSFSVYPNPAKDQIRVDFGKTINNSTMNVFNILGVLSHSQIVNEAAFVDYQLPEAQGVYFIQLVDAKGTTSSLKVIKE